MVATIGAQNQPGRLTVSIAEATATSTVTAATATTRELAATATTGMWP
jgi:hypothetical protein